MEWTWQFNPASLFALISGVIAVVVALTRSNDRSERAEKKAEAAIKRADEAHESLQILQAAISAYRETQAERLVSREILREVEDRLAASIERLGDRLDSLVKELVMDRRQP